jgi:cobalt-zinc-cadmium efflux system protein
LDTNTLATAKVMNTFLIGIGLVMAFALTEFIAGCTYNSKALLTDAVHNLTDVASLVISLVTFLIRKKQSSADYTYGFKKTTWSPLLMLFFFSFQ